MTTARVPLAFLFDVDNTLLDNDRVRRDLATAIESLVGAQRAARFWDTYQEVRIAYDYVDLPHTLERFSREFPEERAFPTMSDAVLSYPYRWAAFPGAHDVLRLAARAGTVAILSDGDPVYQPAKIARAGFPDLIDGPVLVFDHKEERLAEVQRRIPAERYVLIDDKPRILAAVKGAMGDRVATVHVCQGKYAHDGEHDEFPDADRTVDKIADMLELDLDSYQASPR